jgi:hypothetical protein
MDRRTFLKTTGGLAAGAALTADMLRGHIANQTHRGPDDGEPQLRSFPGLAA